MGHFACSEGADNLGGNSVSSSNAATDVRPVPRAVAVDEDRSDAGWPLFLGLLAVLLATGWAANHFAGLMPAIRDQQHLSAAALNAIFGIYAVGLLPGLLIGGRASDAFGRQAVAWAGSATMLAGTVAMLFSQEPAVLLIGRVVLGFGVGFAISSCTAWASDLRGPAGAAIAGAVLTAGFAIGPFAGGVIALAGRPGIQVSFAIAAVLVVLTTVIAVLAAQRAAASPPAAARATATQQSLWRQGSARALSWVLPLAPWVFASATLAFVTIPTRVHTGLAAPLAAGTATLIANGASATTQLVARSRGWGPQAGTVGALLAAFGYAVTAATPSPMPLDLGVALIVVLGCASGLLLREGLIDLEAAAPQRVRGSLTGLFYTVAYIGFGLPLLLVAVGSPNFSAMILAAMAVLATATAVGRALRLRRDAHRQS
jgi:MFS family permease